MLLTLVCLIISFLNIAFVPLTSVAVPFDGLYMAIGGGIGERNSYHAYFSGLIPKIPIDSTINIEELSNDYVMDSASSYSMFVALGQVFDSKWAIEGEMAYRRADQGALKSTLTRIESQQATLMINFYRYAQMTGIINFYLGLGMGIGFYNGLGNYDAFGVDEATGIEYGSEGAFANALKATLAMQAKIGLSYLISSAMMLGIEVNLFGTNEINYPHDIGSFGWIYQRDTIDRINTITIPENSLILTGIGTVNGSINATLRLFFAT